MSAFRASVSTRHPDKLIIMVIDGAPSPRSGQLIIPENMTLVRLPPYAPELNPVKHVWDELREKDFANRVFDSLDAALAQAARGLMRLEAHPDVLQSIVRWEWILLIRPIKIDIRKVSDRERALLRKQVIRLRKQGKRNNETAELLGLPATTTSRWWQRFQRERKSMLSEPKRGRKHGKKRTMSPQKEMQIQKMIVDHYPEQLKLPFALLDRQAIKKLILLQFGIDMPIRTIGHYLSRWGYTPQRPIRKAYEQRPVEVGRWMQESYPTITAKATTENAEIYWSDETGIATNGNLVRGDAPVGKTPELRINARREHISMISAINNQESYALCCMKML